MESSSQLISLLVAAVMPWIINNVTNRIKTTVAGTAKSAQRTTVIRAVVAVLALGTAATNAYLTGGPLDETVVSQSIETIAYALFAGVGAHVIHTSGKKEEE